VVFASLISVILAAVTPHGVQSTYFPGAGKAPVVVWGGSAPDPPDALAAQLAAAGHPALSVAYFGRPGLPEELESIPLEYFARAIREFDARPGIDRRRVVVFGNSRGAEAALLVAEHYPRLVHGVIATAPSSKAYSAVLTGQLPAWTFRGKPVPYAVIDDPDPKIETKAIIPVERINGPILLGSGADDELYDSAGYAREILRRLDRRGFAFRVRSVVFPDTGHSVSAKLLPIALRFLDAGDQRGSE
jgi:pimeloyl-ACP methyl ester carboxylesterase